MKKIFALFAIVFSFLLLTVSVSASCGGQYESPCQSYSIIVDKTVQKPGTSDYVDNLSVSDPRFKPDNFIMFRVTVKNTSSTNLVGMTVKDYVPSYLTPIEGPGTFDQSTRTVEWNAGDFGVNEQKTFYLKMQITSQANLPADKGLFCLINKAQAWSSNAVDDDSSQFCIEKQVTGTVQVPSAGPELGLILFASEIALMGAGLTIKRFTK